MPHTMLRFPTVKARTGLSRSTIYLRISRGTFPAPVSLGGRAVGWIEAEVQAWLTARIAQRRRRPRHVHGEIGARFTGRAARTNQRIRHRAPASPGGRPHHQRGSDGRARATARLPGDTGDGPRHSKPRHGGANVKPHGSPRRKRRATTTTAGLTASAPTAPPPPPSCLPSAKA